MPNRSSNASASRSGNFSAPTTTNCKLPKSSGEQRAQVRLQKCRRRQQERHAVVAHQLADGRRGRAGWDDTRRPRPSTAGSQSVTVNPNE